MKTMYAKTMEQAENYALQNGSLYTHRNYQCECGESSGVLISFPQIQIIVCEQCYENVPSINTIISKP